MDVVFDGSPLPQPPVANNDSGFVATDEHRIADSGFGVARQRHGPQWAAAVDHRGEQSEQRHRHLQLEHADDQFRADDRLLGSAGFTYTITDGQGGTASANVALTVKSGARVCSLAIRRPRSR